MTTDIEIKIRTEHDSRQVVGGDNIVLSLPPEFLIEDDGPVAVLVQQLAVALRKLAEAQAVNLDEVLHHADFWVTTDPDTVKVHGVLASHVDCAECQTALTTCLATMAENPGKHWVVGELYWAEQPKVRRVPDEQRRPRGHG